MPQTGNPSYLGVTSSPTGGPRLLFHVLTEREGKASVAIASNESFSKAHMFVRTCEVMPKF